MNRAISSGKELENIVLNILSSMSNIVNTKDYTSNMKSVSISQHKYRDIFTNNARVDFFHVNNYGKKFYIECKNQKVPGSVDTKFPYYILNITQNIYEDAVLVFILNTEGVRKCVLEWLVKQTELYPFYIISIKKLEILDNLLSNPELSNNKVFL